MVPGSRVEKQSRVYGAGRPFGDSYWCRAMNRWLEDPDLLAELRREALALAEHFKLPFRQHVWRGQSGDFAGTGVGSSIDFQDHRNYLPGDDPRHINWQAYARTGNYSMKLYREEVRPLMDVVFDVSASMFTGEEKARRSLELLSFIVEASGREGAAVTMFLVGSDGFRHVSADAWRSGRWADLAGELSVVGPPKHPALRFVPLRGGSFRVFVSDLLFPGEPGPLTALLAAQQGRGVVLAPMTRAEADPDWSGNYEFVEAEAGTRHPHRVERLVLRRYAEAYRAHFAMWRESARKRSVKLARVPSEGGLAEALREEALREGAVELWS